MVANRRQVKLCAASVNLCFATVVPKIRFANFFPFQKYSSEIKAVDPRAIWSSTSSLANLCSFLFDRVLNLVFFVFWFRCTLWNAEKLTFDYAKRQSWICFFFHDMNDNNGALFENCRHYRLPNHSATTPARKQFLQPILPFPPLKCRKVRWPKRTKHIIVENVKVT